MANITSFVDDELHKKMKKHPEMRWSEVARGSIREKVEILEVMDKIASKSKLTKKDVEDISRKVNMDTFEGLNKK